MVGLLLCAAPLNAKEPAPPELVLKSADTHHRKSNLYYDHMVIDHDKVILDSVQRDCHSNPKGVTRI
jgi:hypothetical protein